MSGDWKDRIAGIKRIVLALGVMSLCGVASQEFGLQPAETDPNRVETRNAQYEDCSADARASKLKTFGCAVVLKAKVKTSSIRFLSATREDAGARNTGGPVFKRPEAK
ncbi:hypothetical protein [Pseudorhodobacter ferrugineus]|uniref:hypothetical protein n=1 Tax=Pseudorhodobacter ferrugineus TaxID=77008 RepID=UPI0003B4CC9A|nr:hypothetical protein [Pseudorhodobacter ferrugineus]